VKLILKPHESELLKLKCDDPLRDFAFNFNLRRYTVVAAASAAAEPTLVTLLPCVASGGGGGGGGGTVTRLQLPGRVPIEWPPADHGRDKHIVCRVVHCASDPH